MSVFYCEFTDGQGLVCGAPSDPAMRRGDEYRCYRHARGRSYVRCEGLSCSWYTNYRSHLCGSCLSVRLSRLRSIEEQQRRARAICHHYISGTPGEYRLAVETALNVAFPDDVSEVEFLASSDD